MELDETTLAEFQSEVAFLRMLRHRNIVFFFGAGQAESDGVPFLVTEYMQRGALSGILYDTSIELDWPRRTSFAIDAARGLAFLHSQDPPRIHRDVKSANFLVTDAWVVKVADFGT